MATLAQLEEGVRKAYEAGNMDYARVLGAELVRARQGAPAKTEEPDALEKTASIAKQALWDPQVGGAEASASLLSSMAMTPIAGLAGVGAAATKALGLTDIDPGDVVRNVAEATTYSPRTEQGKALLGVAAYPFEKLAEAGQFVGGKTLDATGSPMVAAAADTAVNALPMLISPLKSKAMSIPQVASAVQAVKGGAGKVGAMAKQAGANIVEQIPTRNMPTINEPLPGSVGAAAVNPIQQARALVSNASPELQAAVEATIKRKEPLNLTAVENHIEAETLPVPIQMTKGQATGDPILISEEANLKGKHPEISAALDEQNKALIENVNAIKEKVAPDVYLQNASEHGDVVIEGYKALDDTVLKPPITAAYKALEDANGGKFPMNTQEFVKAAEDNLTKKNRHHHLPGEVRSLINQYKNGLEMDFNGFEELRTILSDDMRAATNGNVRTAIGAVRQALEDLPMGETSAELKALADNARLLTKQRYDKIRSDPAYKAVVDGKALPDNFMNKYVINADSTRLEAMLKNLDLVDSKLRQVAASATINHLKDAAKIRNDTGTFAQNSFNGSLSKLGPKAALLFGEDASTLHQLGRVAQKLKQQPAGSFVNNSNTATALMAEGAKSTAEGLGNVATSAISFGNVKGGTGIRRLIEARKARNEIADSLKPGAGVSAKESKLLEVKRKVLEAKAAKQKSN